MSDLFTRSDDIQNTYTSQKVVKIVMTYEKALII